MIKTAKSPEEKAEDQKILEGLKKSKYVLLKNKEDLSEDSIEFSRLLSKASSEMKLR